MKIITSPEEMRRVCDTTRAAGDTIAFVPTMGALHPGHLQLVTDACRLGTRVVVSIFVNPTQFAPGEDFQTYPRNMDRDTALLRSRGVHFVFAPRAADMFPADNRTTVTVCDLTRGLCGKTRPGHFDGVATVVTKLFNIVGPCTAVFGQKDYQQLRIIQQLTRDLNLPVQIHSVPTVRDPDGLAMSSRNAYLSADERTRALSINRALDEARCRFVPGGSVRALKDIVQAIVVPAVDKVDYITFATPDTLTPLTDDHLPATTLLAIAVHIGTTRLIDNTVLKPS